MYHGGECILRQIYTICGSNYNQYPSALEVVVGTLVGFVVFHEHMTMLQILGAVIIVVGAIGSEIYQPKRS